MPPYKDNGGPHGVLPPDGSGTWHAVASPLDPVALCGDALLYGARLRPWTEVPQDERCGRCLGQLGIEGEPT